MRRTQQAHQQMDAAMFDGRPQKWLDHRPGPMDDREIMRDTTLMGIQTSKIFRDLKVCIVRNRTSIDFITSDDPAIFTSRYYLQRLRSRNFGLSAAGAMLILPISPQFVVMFYDGNVYTIPEKQGHTVSIAKASDAFALNELHYLKASKNIYFSDFKEASGIQQTYRKVEPRKPGAWSVVHAFVPDETAPKGVEKYRIATEGERSTAPMILLQVSNLYPEPSIWISKLLYRSKPRAYSNGSAIAYVRKQEWLTSEGIDRELDRPRRARTTMRG